MLRKATQLLKSATLSTWLSHFARLTNGLIVLPFVLSRFSPAEVAVWLLISTLNTFQILFDGGFTPTFTRFVSYLSGSDLSTDKLKDAGFDVNDSDSLPELRSATFAAMTHVTRVLSLVGVIAFAFGGPLLVSKQASGLPSPAVGFAAVIFLIPSWVLEMNGRKYIAVLEGTGSVALVRRWSAVFGFLTAVSNLLTIILGGRLLALTVSSQVWRWVAVLWNRRLAVSTKAAVTREWCSSDGIKAIAKSRIASVRSVLWKIGLKSAIGVAFGYGTVQLTGVIYAQFAVAQAASSYLLALRILDILKQVSQAPFYSKLPAFGSLYTSNRMADLKREANRRILISLVLLAISTGLVGITGGWLLNLVNSDTAWLPTMPWFILVFAILFERAGAMNLQSYSVTNHIIWHQINSVTGSVIIVVSFVLGRIIGVTGFSIAILAGNLLVYLPWASRYNSRLHREPQLLMLVKQLLIPLTICGLSLFIHVISQG